MCKSNGFANNEDNSRIYKVFADKTSSLLNSNAYDHYQDIIIDFKKKYLYFSDTVGQEDGNISDSSLTPNIKLESKR